MAKEWRIFSITDLVYNHVANDCALLQNHPEAAYNLINSPHLRPAVLLDSILMQFTRDVNDGKLVSRGIPAQIKEYHLQIIRQYFIDDLFPQYRFPEYYICDIKSLVEQFRQQLSKQTNCPTKPSIDNDSNLQLEHGKYQRMKTTIDLQFAENLYFYQRENLSTIEQWRTAACNALNNRLEHLNNLMTKKVIDNLNRAIDNCLSSCRYHFLAFDGPKYDQISHPNKPFVGNYFSYPNDEFKHPNEINRLIENDLDYQMHVMAHNGWVMNDDPLRCFADEGQEVYFRRDLIQWSDLIKLRFGKNKEDCPAVYQYMKEYTRLIATTFHGCRLDNCHSTPLWFAQEMMDYARLLNHNFYINAELFTGNLRTDIHFINQIGINSLVRGELNSIFFEIEIGVCLESFRAFDPRGLCEIASSVSTGDAIGSFFQPKVRPILNVQPYAWFYDQTHDNPSEIERRAVEDVLPRSAIVSMTISSIGSNRGYDELVPHHIDVVHETRVYPKWGYQHQQTNEKTALIPIRKALNKLHVDLAQQGFTQVRHHFFILEQKKSSSCFV